MGLEMIEVDTPVLAKSSNKQSASPSFAAFNQNVELGSANRSDNSNANPVRADNRAPSITTPGSVHVSSAKPASVSVAVVNASPVTQAQSGDRAVSMRTVDNSGVRAELSLNPARQNVQTQNNTAFARNTPAGGQESKTTVAQARSEISAATAQKQSLASRVSSSTSTTISVRSETVTVSARSETVQTAHTSVLDAASHSSSANTARVAVASNATVSAGSAVFASVPSGPMSAATTASASAGTLAASLVNSAATGGMSAQILRVVNSPVLNNMVNTVFPGSVKNDQPAGGVLTMGNNVMAGEKVMLKPIQINLAFANLSTDKTTLTGKNGEKMVFGDIKDAGQLAAAKAGKSGGVLTFGDIGAKANKAQSQPIISFAELSRIAHERDIQKENLSKLINMLFGKIIHKEEQDEDLEGMYGVWRDYLERQREQKDRREQEERRKKKQKQDAELQEEELEAVLAV
jgi:hypothetical protein